MPTRHSKKNKPWGEGSYVSLPHQVLRSAGYANLSAWSVKLLNDLLSQYRGYNNGDLCAAMTILKQRSWKSNATLSRARKELLEKGFIAQSKQGGRNNPTLFSVTFYRVDECINKSTKLSRHEVMPTTKPANTWLKFEPKSCRGMGLKSAQKKQSDIEAGKNILDLESHLNANPEDPVLV